VGERQQAERFTVIRRAGQMRLEQRLGLPPPIFPAGKKDARRCQRIG
jgi:hypothetical protein